MFSICVYFSICTNKLIIKRANQILNFRLPATSQAAPLQMLRIRNEGDVHIEKNVSPDVFIKTKYLQRILKLAHPFHHF